MRFVTPLLKIKVKNKDANNIGQSGSPRTCMWQHFQLQETRFVHHNLLLETRDVPHTPTNFVHKNSSMKSKFSRYQFH